MTGDNTPDMEHYFNSRTRVMIVTSHLIYDETALTGISSLQGVIDFLLTQNKSLAMKPTPSSETTDDRVKKHFIFALHPTVQNYRCTVDTLALASKVDRLLKHLGGDERTLFLVCRDAILMFYRQPFSSEPQAS